MEHKVLRTAEKLQKSHTKKHWLYRGLSVLAAGAVFCTTYALILPAITLDKDAICGNTEHTHTDECYTSTGSWACMDNADTYEMLANADYVAHTHTDECYNEDGAMICPFADWDNLVEPHEHTDECYQIVVHTHDENCMEMVQGELRCTLEENDGHIHDESCLGEVPVLICELPEHEFHTDDCYASGGSIICGLENHEHTDDCYETELVNVCEIEEGEGQHAHTSTCYEYVTKPTCGIEEGAETRALICEKIALHSHTDACYEDGVLVCGQPEVILHQHEHCYEAGEPELTCEIEEHTHTDECYGTYEEVPGMSNVTLASSGVVGENATEWYVKLPAEYTGNWATDLAAVAKSQVGYAEEPDPTVEEPDRTYNMYSAWFDEDDESFVRSNASWNQIFVTWCLTVSDIEATEIPQPYTVEEFWEQAEYQGMLRMDEYTAGTGDIVILLKDDGNFRSGIVDCVDEDGIHVVLGDEDGAVVEQTVTSNDVIAWVSVQYQYNVHHPEQDTGDEITDVESYYNWQAMQDLAASGWFTYWADHPTMYEEETTVVQDTLPAEGEDTSSSSVQIDEKGGTAISDDGHVTVSKTIAGTEDENVFDITLTVTSDTEIKQLYQEPDMAIVLVMDISNTMTELIEGRTKYDAAIEAAEKFVDLFIGETQGVSKLGVVAFNTDAHEILSLQAVTSETKSTFNDTLRGGTGEIIRNYKTDKNGDAIDRKRFTNMEAGLKMAGDMLVDVSNKNKFIIFLTDGLPTTYIKSGYEGWNVYMQDSGVPTDANAEGYFADRTNGKKCLYGTSYSDEAAIRASSMAQTIKNRGISIFSIGVSLQFDSGGYEKNGWEFIKDMINNSNNQNNDYSVIDRGNTTFENLEVVKGFTGFEGTTGWLATDIASMKNDTEGWYFDANDVSSMNKAFTDIFAELKRRIEETSSDLWTVSDPMSFTTNGEVANIKFIKFLDDGDAYPDNHTFDSDVSEITWDLKKSQCETTVEGNKTTYKYQMKYRIRLMNENDQDTFKESQKYFTNDTTRLTYQLIEKVNGEATITEKRTVDFPIPSVHGYLGELSFTKVSRYSDKDTPLSGATFTLTHDPNCTLCTLTEESHNDYWSTVESMDQTETSGTDGIVSFTGIPSGHTYILEETVVPAGHQKPNATYLVYVEYDRVTVKDKNTETVVWKDVSTDEFQYPEYFTFPNYTSYELPATGGTGTKRYILVGVLLMSTAVLLYTVRRRQRE